MGLTKKEALLRELLDLSPIERVEVVETILSGFEKEGREEIDYLWGIESEKRVDNYLSGKTKTFTMDEVFSGIN